MLRGEGFGRAALDFGEWVLIFDPRALDKLFACNRAPLTIVLGEADAFAPWFPLGMRSRFFLR